MTRVLAQGVFDLIHPGHIHYLKKSKSEGGELYVVIARDSRLERDCFFSEEERRGLVQAVEHVDEAVLGSEEDIFSTVEKLEPDVITLGGDQKHEPEKVKEKAEKAAGKQIRVTRISEKEGYSSSKIRDFYG